MSILRLLLAYIVLVSHVTIHKGIDGGNAVQLFYLISGYLIALVLASKYEGKGVSSYFVSRFLRIFPFYWFHLGVGAIALLFLSFNQSCGYPSCWLLKLELADPSWLWAVGANIFIVTSDLVHLGEFFDPLKSSIASSVSKNELYKLLVIPQISSVSLELYFYLIAPFLCNRKGLLLVISVSTIAMKLTLAYFGLNSSPFAYQIFPLEMGIFTLGALIFHYRSKVRDLELLPLSRIVSGLVIILCVVSIRRFEDVTPFASIALIFSVSLFLPRLSDYDKKFSWAKFFGDLSYVVFLNHLLILALLKLLFPVYNFDSFSGAFYVSLLSTALAILVMKMRDLLVSYFLRGRRTWLY